jgi:hypothetical protein
MHLPKVPASCEHVDLALVERTLAKHYGDISAAARELRVSIPDLRHLTWAKPKLLEEAELERMGIIARAWGVLIEALYSNDTRRQMWASDKIMSSWIARDHPLAPARGRGAPLCEVKFRWQDPDDLKATESPRRSPSVTNKHQIALERLSWPANAEFYPSCWPGFSPAESAITGSAD